MRSRLAGLLLFAIAAAPASADPEPLLVDVTANGAHRGVSLLLQDDAGDYLVSHSDLASWGVRGPYPASARFNNEPYAALNQMGEIETRFDMSQARIALAFPVRLLAQQTSRLLRPEPELTESGTGFYVDYDLAYAAAAESEISALVAPRFFSPIGTIRTELLYRDRNTGPGTPDRGGNWTRLETTYTRDDPDRMRSLRLGDVVSQPGPWSSALRLGGIQIASNFNTRPQFVTFPVPTLSGEAALPSTLDLVVNGRLRHRDEVAPGEFQLENIPVVTGAGQMQLVVTDALGRKRVYTQDFYASSELLRPGLHEYSYSLGAVRRNFGYQSNDYGDPAILGSHRIGVTDGLTLGGRAAWSSSARLAAATLDLAAGTRGTMSATLGMSDSPAGKGEAFSLGYRYLSQRLRIMARAVGTSAAFQPIEDMSARRLNPQAQIVLAADWSGTGRGSMGITLIRQRYHDKTERKLITLNYRRTFLGEIAVSAFLTRALGPATDLSLGINVSRPLGGGRNLSALALRTRAGSRLRMETQRSLPLGPGFGYRMGTVMGDDRTFDAALVGQTDYGRYRIEADTVGDETSWQASASGSVAWLADRPYLTREISDGFAVARVGNLENVRVYLENQEIGRSDASGRVLLPRLRPYEINRISIDPLDLPLTADVPFVSIDVAPAYGSGVTVEFPVQLTYSALARAVSPDGEPLPEGARVNVSGQTEPSVIGIDGKLFLNSRNASIEATAGLGSERCGFRVDLPAAARTLAQLGDIVCEPMP